MTEGETALALAMTDEMGNVSLYIPEEDIDAEQITRFVVTVIGFQTALHSDTVEREYLQEARLYYRDLTNDGISDAAVFLVTASSNDAHIEDAFVINGADGTLYNVPDAADVIRKNTVVNEYNVPELHLRYRPAIIMHDESYIRNYEYSVIVDRYGTRLSADVTITFSDKKYGASSLELPYVFEHDVFSADLDYSYRDSANAPEAHPDETIDVPYVPEWFVQYSDGYITLHLSEDGVPHFTYEYGTEFEYDVGLPEYSYSDMIEARLIAE